MPLRLRASVSLRQKSEVFPPDGLRLQLSQTWHLPAGAVGAADEFSGGGAVGEFELGGVPFEPLAGNAVGHGTDEDGFGERAAVREVVAGGVAFEDGIDPIVVVVLGLELRIFFCG